MTEPQRTVRLADALEVCQRNEAIKQALESGAEPYRDLDGQLLEVDFIDANAERVEPWRHDRNHKKLYRRNQKLAKLSGQLIGQPGDRIETAKHLAVLHHRQGADIEGAVRRGLFDAIWRYDIVFDTFTVPRRYGNHILRPGRIAAVAEEVRRRHSLPPGFWVRNRRNTGLVYVVPLPASQRATA
ncbi:hypothetical protein [Pelagibius sp.]|uniref:hypothetical protein n=1 Tax=Pelagibius sp. TaxID=1931238 RepID=UPI003BAEEE72